MRLRDHRTLLTPLEDPLSERRLSVKKERLAELTTDDLYRVVGAAEDAPPTLPLRDCVVIKTLQGCTTNIYCP